jgi:cytochrome c556
MKSKYLLGLSILAIGATAVYAQNVDAVKKRREAMKAIATAGSANFQMLKGSAPFDLAKVQAGLKVYQDEGAKLKPLFPDDSKTGGETEAPAKIWQAKAEFEKEIDTFIATAKAAAPLIKDEATFKAEYPKVAQSCGGCHKDEGGFAPKLSESLKRLKQ